MREPSTPVDREDGGGELLRAYRLSLSLAVVCLGLAAAVLYLLVARRRPDAAAQLESPVVRAAAVARLVDLGAGIWDTFPDPDVGRVLQPNLQGRQAFGSPVSSNAFGWREGKVDLAKPAGTLRVVLLGDSFVFGPGIDPGERIGPFLGKFLEQRATARPLRVETLHIGMASWNIEAETSYLRRNLSNLKPDLVVQIVVSNDLDDSATARGFGTVADFSSQHPEQTATVYDFYPIWGLGLGFQQASYLNAALSYEGRHRYQEAAERLARLERAVRAAGGEYLLLVSWADQPKTAAHYLPRELPTAAAIYLPDSFRRDRRYRISSSNPHWTPAGNERLAKYLYGAIRDRRLLARAALADWPEAAEIFRDLESEGEKEADRSSPIDLAPWSSRVEPAVDFEHLTAVTAPQIYAGVDGQGFVAPYASVLLERGGARRVHLRGRALPAAELGGARVRVYCDEVEVGSFTLEPGTPLDLAYGLPPAIAKRPFFDVRFRADDWVYTGPNLRRSIVFRLDRLEALP